jgi:enoyl-CoA hydratase/carnithine racemase
LINEVVPGNQLLPTALTWARQLAESGPLALARTKELLAEFSAGPLARDKAAKGSADARLTVECKEGLRAFLEKRVAPWMGGSQ